MKDTTLDAALDTLIARTQREFDDDAAQRAAVPPPELHLPDRPRWSARQIAAAAALLAVVAGASAATAIAAWSPEEAPGELPVAAEHQRAEDREQHSAEPAGGPAANNPDAANEPSTALLDQLAALDAEAQRRWKAGDRDGAAELFEEIIRRGRTTQYADLAFGDLFSLAGQGSSTAGAASLRRRYLARFPRGRFADDAQAWLCRHSAKDSAACWRGYLRRRPKGTYRNEAMRSLGEHAKGR